MLCWSLVQPSGEQATIKWVTVGGRTSAYVAELQQLVSSSSKRDQVRTRRALVHKHFLIFLKPSSNDLPSGSDDFIDDEAEEYSEDDEDESEWPDRAVSKHYQLMS